MPEANPEGTLTQETGQAPEKTNGKQAPANLREHKVRARESREEALQRAFGEMPDDDNPLDFTPEAGSSEEEAVETEPEQQTSPASAASSEQVQALMERVRTLEQRLRAEKERQEEPDELDEDFDYDVDVEPGFEALKPTFKAVGERAEKQNRELQKSQRELTQKMFELRAQVDLNRFASTHPDFWQIADRIAATAEKEDMDLFDYKSLNVAYDLVKGRAALTRLAEAEKKKATVEKMQEKAGPARSFRTTQQQVRDEDVAPGNKLLNFQEAWDKSVSKLSRSSRRS